MWETAFLIITGVSQKVIGKIHYNLHFCQKIHNTVKHQLCFCTYVCIFEWNCTVCHMSTYGKRSTLFWKTRNCYCGGNVCRILATMWKMRKTDKSIFFFPFSGRLSQTPADLRPFPHNYVSTAHWSQICLSICNVRTEPWKVCF